MPHFSQATAGDKTQSSRKFSMQNFRIIYQCRISTSRIRRRFSERSEAREQAYDNFTPAYVSRIIREGFEKRIVAYITVNRVRREHYLCLMRQGNMLDDRRSRGWLRGSNKYLSHRLTWLRFRINIFICVLAVIF